jgi:hypothetical protein
MDKDNKCHNKSSDNSEVCYNVKCKPKCKKDCCIEKCKCYDPEELVCLYKDAVVEIHSEFILLGTGYTGNSPVSSATGGTPLASDSRTDVILEGNGFFIKGHYIVAPAQLVLMPPSLTSLVNRYPFFDPNDLTLGSIKNQMIRASRILVSVFNVNGKGHSFIYEADLVGVDGAGDIAVLRINYKKQWNQCNPCIEKCHPEFTFGSSRGSKDGEKVYLIGDYISNASNRRLFNASGAISDGLLSDHRYVDYSGFGLAESVLVSAPSYAFSAGLPILNCQGYVIGMQTNDLAAVVPKICVGEGSDKTQAEGAGFVAGPSEFFLRRVVKTIIKGTCGRKYNCQLETICDPVGAFYRYKKAYAGIAYDVFTGIDYDVTVDYTSGCNKSGFPRVRLSSTGEFLGSPSCKELVGIRVLGLAGGNPEDANGIANGLWYVPGGTGCTPLVSFLPHSPFLGKLLPGDVITHIEGVGLGDLNKQISPSLITWRLCAGDQIEICYRRGGNAVNTSDNSLTENYDNMFSHTICLLDFPFLMDYPWYAVNIFPLLKNRGFNFHSNQLDNPQFPQLAGGAAFHPAF